MVVLVEQFYILIVAVVTQIFLLMGLSWVTYTFRERSVQGTGVAGLYQQDDTDVSCLVGVMYGGEHWGKKGGGHRGIH